MAPEKAQTRRKPKENNYLFDLGVRGRKTGLTLPDNGIRDENGLEPMEHLFSSPEKPKSGRPAKQTNGTWQGANSTISTEEDMDVGESTIPEPAELLTGRKSMRLPPRSKSPIKTFLQSPARRNPSLGPVSSPIRGSIVAPASPSASVRRRLDFSRDSLGANDESEISGSPAKRASSLKPALNTAKLTNGSRLLPPMNTHQQRIEGDEDTQMTVDENVEAAEDSYQVLNGGDEEDISALAEPVDAADESEPEVEPLRKPKAKPKGSKAKVKGPQAPLLPEVSDVAVKRGRGRARRSITYGQDQEPEERPAKRARTSGATKTAPKIPEKPRQTLAVKRGRGKGASGSKMATIIEGESPEAHRGPPMPKGRGLFILRRETPMEGTAFKQTRSGRNSIKPISCWKNEKIEYEEEEIEDGNMRFLVPRIKEVVRKDEVQEPKRHKPTISKSRKAKKRAAPDSDLDDDNEEETWESEPGRIVGEVRDWDPEDQTGSQTYEREEEIALSSAAIITRDIVGASFRFAKTLTLPFFGSGMVDLPPGGIKKLKNSRKMHMVFFVYYGRVQVTVNDTVFRIGKGGMWQVPRGNFYGIENDYDKPARIFFSQGCEIEAASVEGQITLPEAQ